MTIYVWGTGCAAGDLIDAGLAVGQVTAFLDSEAQGGSFLGRPVLRPEAVDTDSEYLILVASRHVEEIARQAAACGIGESRLLFLRDNWALTDRNPDYGEAQKLLPPALLSSLQTPPRAIRPLPPPPGSPLPERRLYLFDTFEGFDPAEAQGQGDGFAEAHRNTSIERVLRLLPHPEQAVIRQGLFPASAAGLESERFALVSLDVDLEESTLAGLRWFIPRMQEGGFLLLHDYNNPKLPGVKRAVSRFEQEYGHLHAVPLCDVNGTLVFSV